MDFHLSLGNGIALKVDGQTILLDPKISDFISFVSHAHADHSPRDIITKPYCTRETYELIKVRDSNFQANVVKEGKELKFDGFSAKMFSSGHVLGSTQILIETGEESILYTGDFKMEQGLTCKSLDIQKADVLITEATYGRPEFVFPSVENVREEIARWTSEQIEKGFKINFGGYPIGKSEEIIKLLNNKGISPKVSETIRKYCEVYNDFGMKLKFLEKETSSDIFVRPMHDIYSIREKKSKNCVLTGWSLFRNSGVLGFPLSDHCDFNQLIKFVKEVEPKKVYCVHGYKKEFAKEVRSRLGIPARALQKNGQKNLIDFN